MLRVSNLTLCINERPLFRDLSFWVSANETLAIMGPSGCGKTTLLKAIAGFVREFDAGDIGYAGQIWQRARHCELCRAIQLSARQRPTALLFQELAVWPHLTVTEQLDLVGQPGEATKAMIAELGLKERAQAPARELSGGEKQRLALGRVLKTSPKVLLLDEPFASLDQSTKLSMIALVKRYQHELGYSIVVATHDLREAEMLGARVLKLGEQ